MRQKLQNHLCYFRRFCRAGIVATALASSAVCAQPSLVERARELVRTGHAAEAFQLLAPEETQYAGDTDFDLELAIAANETGNFPRAILALERVLAAHPGNARARVEMGRALYGVGDNKGARTLLSEGRDRGFASVAGETIDQILHAIDRVEAEGASSYKGYAEFAIGDDSNLNSSPGLTSIAVPAFGGAVLIVDPAAARAHAAFALVGGGLSGRYVIDPRWSLIGNATARAEYYGGDHSRFDFRQFDANGGLSYRVERNEYTLVAQVGTYDLDRDRARNAFGAVGEWTYRFDGFRQFNAYVQAGRLEYPALRISDVDRYVAGATYAHLSRGGVWAYGGAYVGAEIPVNAGVPWFGHHLWGVRGGVQFPLGANLGAFVTAGWEERNFGGTDPSFLVERRDRQANLSAGLSWVPAPQWRLTPQWQGTRTHSNVPLARFDKDVWSVTLRREF
jgi:hypothetical protein